MLLDLVGAELRPVRHGDEGRETLAEVLVRDADDGHLAHRRVLGEQGLDLGRVDVLTAADDHVVVPAVDEVQVALDVTDVPGGDEPVDEVLRLAVGVAVEDEVVAAEDAALLPRRDLLAVVVEDLHDRAQRRGARGVGVAAHVLRGRDADPGGLGGAVEVVEHVAVLVHELRREARGVGRAGGRDDPQLTAGLGGRVARQLHHPLEHHRDGEHRVRLLLLERRPRGLRLEPALQDDRGPQGHRELHGRVAPGVEDRGGDEDPVVGAQRDPVDDRDQRTEATRGLARGSLRRTRRPRGEDDRPTTALGHRQVLRPRHGLDSAGQLALGDERDGVGQVARDLGELVVVDERLDLLLLGDLGELRAGEAGVAEDEVDADRRRGAHDLDGLDVVAGEEADPVAGREAHLTEDDGDLLGVGEQLGVGRGAAGLVDDGDRLRRTVGGLADLAREAEAPLLQGGQLLDLVARRPGGEHAPLGHGLDDGQVVHSQIRPSGCRTWRGTWRPRRRRP